MDRGQKGTSSSPAAGAVSPVRHELVLAPALRSLNPAPCEDRPVLSQAWEQGCGGLSTTSQGEVRNYSWDSVSFTEATFQKRSVVMPIRWLAYSLVLKWPGNSSRWCEPPCVRNLSKCCGRTVPGHTSHDCYRCPQLPSETMALDTALASGMCAARLCHDTRLSWVSRDYTVIQCSCSLLCLCLTL